MCAVAFFLSPFLFFSCSFFRSLDIFASSYEYSCESKRNYNYICAAFLFLLLFRFIPILFSRFFSSIKCDGVMCICYFHLISIDSACPSELYTIQIMKIVPALLCLSVCVFCIYFMLWLCGWIDDECYFFRLTRNFHTVAHTHTLRQPNTDTHTQVCIIYIFIASVW